MPKILQIAQLGHQVLRSECIEIALLDELGTQDLRNDMLVTMQDTNGVGIAAPQVYVLKRCFIFSSRPGPGRNDIPLIEPTFTINPEIVHVSDEKEKGWEACLSIPGIRGLVPRHKNIKVRYTTIDGAVVESDLSGFPARVFQHECDHLDGLVYLDRLDSTRDIIMEKEYQKMLSQIS